MSFTAFEAPRMLFVVGAGRSGTSAFARLLGRHGRIVIGMERYIKLPSERPIAEFPNDLFTKDVFFGPDFNPPRSAARHYEEQRKKFDDALWIGDKVPSWISHVEELRKRYPDSKFLFMMRDPMQVGCSWASRAKTADGGYWLGKSFDQGVAACARNFQRAAQILRSGFEGFYVVEFDRIFPYDVAYLRSTLSLLDLVPDERIVEYYEASKLKSEMVLQKPRAATNEQEKLVSKSVDPGLIEFLRQHNVERAASRSVQS